ncbi:MAG TPA: DUF2238 domain-containing protein [Pyrinomonadaceae bacterium]|nr:DUF2238 domain-containing protein [Pyrinomonadaceae bacterium]
MSELVKRFQWPIIVLMILIGAAFLLKMCYLSLAFNTGFGVTYLTCVYLFAKARWGVTLPPSLLALVLVGVEVDALGNYFRMYGQSFGPLKYDQFAHMTIQILVTPLVVWLMREALERTGQQLSLGFTTFFAGSVIFGISAFYEVIELWDELYFGGQRIWSTRDTSTDLQFDLFGIVIGALFAYLVLRRDSAGAQASLPAYLEQELLKNQK